MEERKFARVLLAIWFVSLLLLTLSPFGTLREVPRAWSSGSRLGTLDFLGNIALYLPLGILAVRLGQRRLLVVAAGILLSFAIESAQMYIAQRYPSGLDVVANTVGTAVGALFSAPLWLITWRVGSRLWSPLRRARN